jgi:hypothetical protein
VNAVAIDGDNNIIVSAIRSAGFYNTMVTLLRYKPDGSLDQSFNSTGVVHSVLGINPYWPQAMAVQKDNKIVVSGSILNANNLFTYVVHVSMQMAIRIATSMVPVKIQHSLRGIARSMFLH